MTNKRSDVMKKHWASAAGRRHRRALAMAAHSKALEKLATANRKRQSALEYWSSSRSKSHRKALSRAMKRYWAG